MNALAMQLWANKRDFALVGLVVGILLLLFVPVPSPLLDLLLVINISTALLILLVTFFTESPLRFSTFPTILLLVTMFRLALNVSATRLILEGADAGRVINAIGEFVVGGNYVVGIVVFLILVVVQYVVVTNGAQRVAEVAARFTLDSMPGKQMSIDADMNMGLIDDKEARRRRELVEREANFYGAMDGATKFVKGDAIAGIVIILINIVGGLAIGIVQLGMPWSEALRTFTLLTVGDGIVTQIPSLVIAVATGIIITRAASDGQLGAEIPRQILSQPRALAVVGAALVGILLLPGFPKLPVLMVLVLVAALAWFAMRAGKAAGQAEPAGDSAEPGPKPAADDLHRLLRVEPLDIRLGASLAKAFLDEGDLADRIAQLRRQVAQDLGLVFPSARVEASAELPAGTYEILLHGSRIGLGELRLEHVLAINAGGTRPRLEGSETRDPAYGLPAQWIAKEHRQFAKGAGYTLVDPDTVLVTHLSELVKRHAAELLSRAETERMVQRLRESHASLVEELVPAVLGYSDIQKVLQHLLREQVSIRNLEAILEVLVDAGRTTKVPEDLAEKVRERLGPAICQRLCDAKGDLHVLTLAPETERALLANQRGDARGLLFADMAQMDAFIRSLGRQAELMMARNLLPVLLCPSPLRRPLRGLLQRSLPYISVIGVNEVPSSLRVRSFSAVQTGLPAVAA